MNVPARVPFPAVFQQICDRTEATPDTLPRSLAAAPLLPLLLVLCGATLISRWAHRGLWRLTRFTAQLGRLVRAVTIARTVPGGCDSAPATVTLARKPS
jgi:hypothetical protein